MPTIAGIRLTRKHPMKLRLLAAATAALTVMTAAPALAASPVISNQTNSVLVVYPVVDGYVDTITFTWKIDQPVTALQLDVVDSTNTAVFTQSLDQAVETTSFVWNGRLQGGALAPAGSYYARITASNGTDPVDSNNGPAFQVSAKKLTEKTFTKQVTAAGSMVLKHAGRCSTVRQPGRKLGTGSIGYYSNTTCTKPGEDLAATMHMLRMPAAFKPGTVSISTYGAAVKAGSVMRVGTLARPWKLSSAKGWHAGPTLSAAGLVDPEGSFLWVAQAAGGNRYDIKYFKITYRYTVLA